MNYDYENTPVRVLDNYIFHELSFFYKRTDRNTFISDSISQQDVYIELPQDRFEGPSTNCTNHITIPLGFFDFSWCSIAFFWSLQEIANQAQMLDPGIKEVNLNNYYITARSLELGPLCDKILESKKEYEVFKRQGRLDEYASVDCIPFIWDENCINPIFNSSEQDIPIFINLTNGIYSRAMTFCILHEFGHIFHHHTFIDGIGNIEQEKEADSYAIKKLLNHSDKMLNNPLSCGLAAVISFLIQLLFLDPDYRQYTVREHPPLQDRIRNILEILQEYAISSEDLNYLYSFSIQIFSLFLRNKGEQNLFESTIDNEKEKFYELLNIIDKYIYIDFE